MGRLKAAIFPLSFLLLLFIFFGDRVLPSPFNFYSWQLRTGLNRMLGGAAPQIKQIDPYERTEKAIREHERR